MLEVKHSYVDTRFKTAVSKSDSDFTSELTKSINIPEDTIAYINDIVLPVSWTTIDEIINTLQYSMLHDADGGWDKSHLVLPTGFKKHKGSTLADEMMEKIDDGLFDTMQGKSNSVLIISMVKSTKT